MHFDCGQVVLVRFPFTDLSASKKRPAVVISASGFTERYGDVVVLALTSRRQNDELPQLDDWQEAGLIKPTWVKPLIGTITSSLIDTSLGVLTVRDKRRVISLLDTIVPREW